MVYAGLTLATLAAVIHVYIFYLESLVWTGDKARATFGITEEEAQATKQLAYNQGFYNLFLAIIVFLGVGFYVFGSRTIGATLALTGAGSMVAASLVLLLSSSDKQSAALKQGATPAVGVVLMVLGSIL